MQPAEQVNGHVTQERTLLDQIAEEQARVGARYMPTLTVKQFTEREKLLRELREMLVEGVDYGVIPGTQKPTLLLPGAQKINAFFAYVPHYTETAIEEWTSGSSWCGVTMSDGWAYALSTAKEDAEKTLTVKVNR